MSVTSFASAPSATSSPASVLGSRRIESRRRARAERAALTQGLLERAYSTDDPRARRAHLDDVIVANLEVAQAIARRYRRRGVSDDDLEQAAYEGLVKAVQRFDPTKDKDLLTYAVPTVRGEVQRHFRDRSWMVRPPRSIQELQWRINRTTEALTHENGRAPADSEVREALDVDDDAFREASGSFGCFQPMSLDHRLSESGLSLGEAIADERVDGAGSLGAAEARTALAPAMARLSARDREIVFLRYFEERTQEDIGDLMGVTQMQVSRLLSRILRDLRSELGSTA